MVLFVCLFVCLAAIQRRNDSSLTLPFEGVCVCVCVRVCVCVFAHGVRRGVLHVHACMHVHRLACCVMRVFTS